jgi:hypothetical protein
MSTDLIPGVGAGTLLESTLLADDRSVRIGAIHRLDYGEAIVLTHDRWKFDAGGIPQFAFLLALRVISPPLVATTTKYCCFVWRVQRRWRWSRTCTPCARRPCGRRCPGARARRRRSS